jgi:hypothetical protein
MVIADSLNGLTGIVRLAVGVAHITQRTPFRIDVAEIQSRIAMLDRDRKNSLQKKKTASHSGWLAVFR